ncbi:unnamed protein product [Cuscuta campestris]|uniref:Retrotransposon gag domain-containing protein n=1 Tax=Cuscuta campestris TaxID=132261 RepID=A0A484KGT1_9ASTE|nr:unnamed protein product [Cuscuta campestris]
MEGIALQWCRWYTKFKGPLTWGELTQAVLQRFGPTDFEDPSGALSHLTQTTIVAAYTESFEQLSHRVDGLPEPFLIGCYIAGLKEEIQYDVKVKKPKNLSEAIGVARVIEEKNNTQKRHPSSNRFTPAGSSTRSTLSSPGLLGPHPNAQSAAKPAAPSQNPVRRITNAEAKERRDKGLCYYCDEKFFPGHRCSKPQLFMICEATVEEPIEPADQVAEILPQNDMPEVSFHAITGTMHPQTIRLMGKIGNKQVMVIVDGGSTHNFIEHSLVTRFGLVIHREETFEVMVANR